jgi:hypothetical protein
MAERSNPPQRFKVAQQEYAVVGVSGYWRERDDRYIELHVIEAVCAHPGCSRVFRAKATKTAIKKRMVRRRCPVHTAPGTPVGDRKPRKAPQQSQRTPRKPQQRQERNPGASAVKPPERASYLD